MPCVTVGDLREAAVQAQVMGNLKRSLSFPNPVHRLLTPSIGGRESQRDDLVNSLLKYRSGEEIRKGDRVLFHGSQL